MGDPIFNILCDKCFTNNLISPFYSMPLHSQKRFTNVDFFCIKCNKKINDEIDQAINEYEKVRHYSKDLHVFLQEKFQDPTEREIVQEKIDEIFELYRKRVIR